MSTQPPPDQPAKSSNELAQERTDLALERTIIAEERTLMAWVRTSVSLIGFGFTIFKFFQYLRSSEDVTGVRVRSPRNLGLTLIALGTVALIMAVITHRRNLRRLGAEDPGYQWSLAVIVSLILALIGLLAFISILIHVGPF